jgi:hypothetical protein
MSEPCCVRVILPLSAPVSPLGAGLAKCFREEPAIPALHPLKQTCHVAPRSFTRFGTGETMRNARVQIRQRVRLSLDRRQFESLARDVPDPLAGEKGERTSPASKCRCRAG